MQLSDDKIKAAVDYIVSQALIEPDTNRKWHAASRPFEDMWNKWGQINSIRF